mgnify:CR=1 FL=1
MSKFIKEMPAELQSRFKAVKSILDSMNDLDEEENYEVRQMDLIYETLYAEIYSQRTEVLLDKMPKEQIKDLVNEFNNKVKVHEMDPSFKEVDVPPFCLKDTLKQKKDGGIANFW